MFRQYNTFDCSDLVFSIALNDLVLIVFDDLLRILDKPLSHPLGVEASRVSRLMRVRIPIRDIRMIQLQSFVTQISLRIRYFSEKILDPATKNTHSSHFPENSKQA